MLIAKQKRKENIAEYILYLWQLEDIFRALNFNADEIYRKLIEPQEITDDQKQEILFWYIDLINLIQTEAKSHHGHIQHTEHLINDLYDLHKQLLQQSPEGKYAALWSKVGPEMPKLKAALDDSQMNDIEVCFRALYSVILCKLKGTEQSAYITDVLETIAPAIAYLTSIYHKAERGEIDMEELGKSI